MTRLYVAGGMSPESFPREVVAARQPWDWNYPAFEAAAGVLRAAGFEVESPHEPGQVEGWGWSDYMRRGVAQLVTCDGVATLDGWEGSRGARTEVGLALAIGMPVRAVAVWLGG